MDSFIHLLFSPSCIVSFNGDFVDVNDWFVKSFKAKSREDILKCNLSDLVIDKAKYQMALDYLLDGNAIRNEKMIVKNMNSKYDVKLTNASVLSFERKEIFVQIFELFIYARPETDRVKPDLQHPEIRLPDGIFPSSQNTTIDDVVCSRTAHLSRRLAYEYPALSKDETIVGALYILGFSSMEIALSTHQSIGTVKETIYNVCRKLNMQSRDEMTDAFLAIDYPGKWKNGYNPDENYQAN